MSLLAVNCRKLNVYPKLKCTPAVSSIFNRFAAYDSKKFPGFKVIYTMESVQRISIINRMKYRTSIGTAIIIPISIGLSFLDTINIELATSFSFLSFSTALFLQSVGIFCNNIVGYIYTKDSTEEVIISYVDFWGKRIDVETTYSQISITDTKNFVMKSFFNTLQIGSHKKTLKFYTKGKVLDDKLFDRIYGIHF